MKRNGFTLLELLTSIAVITVLTAILLPAVQHAREASRRSTCQNNLRQIGLALHNYHDTHSTLPPGCIQSYSAEPRFSGWGWGSLILPFLEASNLHDQIDFSNVTLYGQHPKLISHSLPTWRCPTDPAPDKVTIDAGVVTFDSSVGNYAASATVMRALSNTTFSDLTDGLHTTILVGEMRIHTPSSTNTLIAHWAGELNDPYDTYFNFAPYLYIDQDSLINSAISGIFSSDHSRGVNFLFGDGAVRFISETIDAKRYQAMGTISGGDNVGEF